jgi:UDP-glucose 4-epimerase
MADIIRAVETALCKQIAVRHNPPKPEPHRLTAEITRINTKIGWKPNRSTSPEIITDAWAAWSQT